MTQVSNDGILLSHRTVFVLFQLLLGFLLRSFIVKDINLPESFQVHTQVLLKV
jgi:hypothetical protein